MATKGSTKALAKRQGAKFEEGKDSNGDYWARVTLPSGRVWDNGYGLNQAHKSRGQDETMVEFWLAFQDELTCAVIYE